ncbi:MAG: hypothetical protein H5T43_01375 [Methanomethylovorans sp.]|nr:hypothetical protein [Methanomethylovorans sp.]
MESPRWKFPHTTIHAKRAATMAVRSSPLIRRSRKCLYSEKNAPMNSKRVNLGGAGAIICMLGNRKRSLSPARRLLCPMISSS